jgi:hypothetical protein
MAPRYLSQYQQIAQSPRRHERATPPWWRPLTNVWGIFGLIIFIGLALQLIDGAVDWIARHRASSAPAQAELLGQQASHAPLK